MALFTLSLESVFCVHGVPASDGSDVNRESSSSERLVSASGLYSGSLSSSLRSSAENRHARSLLTSLTGVAGGTMKGTSPPASTTFLVMALVILGSCWGCFSPVARPAFLNMIIISSDWTMALSTILTCLVPQLMDLALASSFWSMTISLLHSANTSSGMTISLDRLVGDLCLFLNTFFLGGTSILSLLSSLES